MGSSLPFRSLLIYVLCIIVATVGTWGTVTGLIEAYHPSVVALYLIPGLSGAVVGVYGLVSRRSLGQLPVLIQILYALVLLGLIIAATFAGLFLLIAFSFS